MNGPRLVVLGSGSAVNLTRHPTAFALRDAGEKTLLVDAGGGSDVIRQLGRAGIAMASIRQLYVTHLDFDHCGGVVPLVYAAALDPARPTLTVLGSAPVVERLRALCALLADDVEALAGDRLRWRALELERRRQLGAELFLTPFEAKHQRPELGPTGLLLEAGPARICFSGDSRPHRALERHAAGADLLVHEASFADHDVELAARTGHATPLQAAALAAGAQVGALLLVHLDVPPDDEEEEALVRAARGAYDGPLTVARDLLEVPLSPLVASR